MRPRFGEGILDTCRRPYDRAWLDYQEEIALRHTRTKKNQTDDARSVPHIPLRYMVAFVYPITATMRDFLAKEGPRAGGGRGDAPGVVQGGDPPGRAVVGALRSRGRLVSPRVLAPRRPG